MIDTSSGGKAGTGQEESKTDGDKKEAAEEEYINKCTHPPTSKCIKCIGKTAPVDSGTKARCTHGPNQKCPNCFQWDEGMVQDRKHESFDSFLKEMFKRCAKSHKKGQKCPNCTFS